MRRLSMSMQVFLSILGVSLGSVVVAAFLARRALSRAFEGYLSTLPSGRMQGRPGMGRMMLGAAEQTFLDSVNRSAVIAAFVAIAIAVVVALLLASYLARPLRRLEHAAESVAHGDLTHRVPLEGPAEAAALGEAFNRMADSLERAEGLRRRLVADVAHELRNPLAAARGQAEGMAEGVLPIDEARLASLVEDLVHLSALIDDLQELAVAEAGRLRYEMERVDIAKLAAREVERVAPLLSPGVVARLEWDGGIAAVSGDERRLGQVLRNLLGNAARHTSSGSIEVRIAVDADNVFVSVVDTGEGIPVEDLPHVFERFYRADSARSASSGGAGLGLAISRSIVTDHGGDVFATSEPATGTTIGFRLPRLR